MAQLRDSWGRSWRAGRSPGTGRILAYSLGLRIQPIHCGAAAIVLAGMIETRHQFGTPTKREKEGSDDGSLCT